MCQLAAGALTYRSLHQVILSAETDVRVSNLGIMTQWDGFLLTNEALIGDFIVLEDV